MKMYKTLLLAVTFFAFFGTHARASDKEALDEAFCPALMDGTAYTKSMKNFKYLVRGEDDWVFRTFVTGKKDFAPDARVVTLFKRLQDELKKKGTDFVLIIPPTSGGAINGEFVTDESKTSYGFDPDAAKKSYAEMLDTLKTAGINAAGVTDFPKGKAFFYRRDHHWNPDGAKASAEEVAKLVKKLPAYEGLQKTTFITKEVGKKMHKGAYEKVMNSICKKRPPAEETTEYKTERAKLTSGADDLFGDNSAAPVVLVGTSNSAADTNYSNFEGFLKEALSLDVLNLAIGGAGVEPALLSYLNSEDFHKAPAKVLVWEIPGYYDFNDVFGTVLQQAIAAVGGDCSGKAIAEVKDVPVKAGTTEIIKDLAAKNVSRDKTYILFEFAQNPKKQFIAQFWSGDVYTDSKIERVSNYPTPKDPYGLFISDIDGLGNIDHVSLKLRDTEAETTVSARLCTME